MFAKAKNTFSGSAGDVSDKAPEKSTGSTLPAPRAFFLRNTLEANRREKEAKVQPTEPAKPAQPVKSKQPVKTTQPVQHKEEVAALKTALKTAVAKKKAAGLQMSSSSSSVYSTPYTTPYTRTETSPMSSSSWQNRGLFNPYTIGRPAVPSQPAMMERIVREEPDRFRYEYQFKIDLTQDTPISIVHR